MGYPKEFLSTRAVVKLGSYAVIPPTGLVNNVIPGIANCIISIVASPKMGASFVQYVITAGPGGGTTKKFGSEQGIETFIYCINGKGTITVGGEQKELVSGGYAYSPEGIGIEFTNTSDNSMKLLLYKQRYIPIEDHSSRIIFGNTNDIPYMDYDEMTNVHIKDLLPIELGFDMNMHILSFDPGGCHPFVETHVQEHGAYILSGEGVYLLDGEWRPVKKEDFIWFGPYVSQGSYGVGRESFTYIYSKDCNRDVQL
jgi:(S)-ureidoglycine aminohydrolase